MKPLAVDPWDVGIAEIGREKAELQGRVETVEARACELQPENTEKAAALREENKKLKASVGRTMARACTALRRSHPVRRQNPPSTSSSRLLLLPHRASRLLSNRPTPPLDMA
jgi:hypothetical protein